MVEFKYNGQSLKGGVYRIVNVQNGRTYYGSCKRFNKRWYQHIQDLLKNQHGNKFLQADFNKCGEQYFVFEVLEVVAGDKQIRLEAEQIFLDRFWDGCKKCYNLNKLAKSPEGRPFSSNPEETRRKLSAVHSGRKQSSEWIAKRTLMLRGKVRTEEQRKKQSETAKKFGILPPLSTGRKPSEETRKKMSDSNKGKHFFTAEMKQKIGDVHRGKKHSEEATKKRRRIYNTSLLSPDGTLYAVIENIADFSLKNSLNRFLLAAVINGRRKSHKGWKLGSPISHCPWGTK